MAIKDRQGHHQAQMVKEQGGKRDFGATGWNPLEAGKETVKANGFFKKQSHEINDFIFVYTFLDELQQPLVIFVFKL